MIDSDLNIDVITLIYLMLLTILSLQFNRGDLKMNKQRLLTASVLTGTLLAGNPVYADEKKCDYLSCFTAKGSQGFFNATTGFIEIPKNIINISHDQNIFVGLTWGTLRGVFHAVGRTVVGAGELITAPIPSREYISPPYVWDRFSEDTRYFGAHLPGFWTTYGPLDDGGPWDNDE